MTKPTAMSVLNLDDPITFLQHLGGSEATSAFATYVGMTLDEYLHELNAAQLIAAEFLWEQLNVKNATIELCGVSSFLRRMDDDSSPYHGQNVMSITTSVDEPTQVELTSPALSAVLILIAVSDLGARAVQGFELVDGVLIAIPFPGPADIALAAEGV